MKTGFEWDKNKRDATFADRGLDFEDTIAGFDGRPLLTIVSDRNGEERFVSVVKLAPGLVSIIWAWRGQSRRIISMRRARGNEEREYRKLYS